MSSLFEIKELSATLGKKEVLSSFSFGAEKGEFVAVLGKNGAGKTTFMRCACGLIKYSGEININGFDIRNLNERKRAGLISYFPQGSHIQSGITVLQTVLMGYTAENGIFGRISEEKKRRAMTFLENVGLSSYADRDFETLSQGEKQLAIFCRCMVQDAPVMLLDEPDGSLDFTNRHKLLSMVRDTVHKNDFAAVIAIHDPNFAFAYCDKIIVLSEGKVSGIIRPAKSSARETEKALAPLYGKIHAEIRNGRPYVFPEECHE